MQITEKVRRFVEEYVVDVNAKEAAIRAGYAPKYADRQGYRLLQDEDVKALLKERMDAKNEELIAKQDEILRYLTSVMRGTSQSEVVVVENIGDFQSKARKVKKKPDEKEQLKAAELLGKRYGLFKDGLNIDAAIPVVICGENELED